MNKDEESITYRRSDIISILRDLNEIVVSLDRIGSEFEGLSGEDEYNRLVEEFLTEWKVINKLSRARTLLQDAFSYDLGPDDMCELEREFKDLEYWSRNATRPRNDGSST
ncbi:MAG: hypothetical protein J5I65_13775 [Aridibacter famidurans]|nr:hypothetical protein [Aridibacter famidurans]